jgi:RimJ/RimL family protein N-acetyltransferase
MEQTITREATLSDLETLLSFEQGIVATERPFDVTLKDGRINYYDIAAMITASHIAVIVAELNGELIGSGYARIESDKPYLKYDKYAYLGFMYVVPEHRGKGVNQKVIKALQQWCATQNISELRLEVYDDNLPAIKAYEKLGFKKLMLKMHIAID